MEAWAKDGYVSKQGPTKPPKPASVQNQILMATVKMCLKIPQASFFVGEVLTSCLTFS